MASGNMVAGMIVFHLLDELIIMAAIHGIMLIVGEKEDSDIRTRVPDVKPKIKLHF